MLFVWIDPQFVLFISSTHPILKSQTNSHTHTHTHTHTVSVHSEIHLPICVLF